nr:mitochondrial succinate-fumarate transporter 1 [Tanacetum cinerariifolium]
MDLVIYGLYAKRMVDDMERLIGNLRTLWVGRLHIHANVVRYELLAKPNSFVGKVPPQTTFHSGSFAAAVKDLISTSQYPVLNLPTLVLDDTCVNDIDLSRFVMGVKSWFDVLHDANSDFICDERIVWVDIEGIPLKVWSHATFAKIGKKWGEIMEIEENLCANFARKRLCIKTTRVDNILETFKVTYKGKVFMARVKELFTWTPCFLELKDEEYNLDDESILDANIKSVNLQQNNDSSDDECNAEKVSDTIFGDIPSSPCSKVFVDNAKEASLHFEDLFGVYDMLRNPGPRGGDESHVVVESDQSLSHPPGFTPVMPQQDFNSNEPANVRDKFVAPLEKEQSPAIHLENKFSPLMSHVNEDSCDFSTSMKSNNTCNGGSILVMLDEMIKVGKSMGYDMEGCSKDIERIIGLQEADEGLISRWKGETIVMGDFNVVRFEGERMQGDICCSLGVQISQDKEIYAVQLPGCDILSPLKELCPQSLELSLRRGFWINEEMRENSIRAYVKALSGSLGGIVEASCLQPIDVIKTRLQLDRSGAYKGIIQCGSTTIKNEGVRALWKGLTPFATHLTLKYALRMGSNAMLQSVFKDGKTGKISDGGRFLSGFGAGVIEALVIVTPFEEVAGRGGRQKEVAGRGGRRKKVTSHGARRKKLAGRGGRQKKVTGKGGLHEEGVWSVEPDLFRSGGRRWKKVEEESPEKVCCEDESPVETGGCVKGRGDLDHWMKNRWMVKICPLDLCQFCGL